MTQMDLVSIVGSIEEEMSGESRAVYLSYVAGVNAYLKKNQNRLPVEYRVIGHRPEPWTIKDCLTIYAGYALFIDLGDFRPFLIPAIDQKIRTRGVFTDPVSPKPQNIPDGSAAEEFLKSIDDVRSEGFLPQGFSFGHCRAVPAARSLSGRPLLLLGLSGDNALPCLYYEMDLKSPSMNVSGFSLPGFPSILFGINASMAWGGGRDERMQSIQIGEINTSRAAVRSGSLSVILAMDSAGNDKLMFRWTDFRDPGEFFFHINRCVSRKEACGLLKRLSAPVMRWICADTAGVTSCVNGSNSPGASEKDYDVKPAFYLSDWLQLRFEMLISEDSVSVMNCQSIQTENYSVFAGRILPIMLEMLSGSPDSTCQFWMGKFKVWDMNMRIGDAEAALFETWMQKVGYHLWYEDLGPLLFRSLMASPSVWQPALVHTFENAEKNPGSEEFIPPDKLCRLSETSLLETLQEVEEQQGKFNSSWSWGKVHAITYRHIISRHSSFKISQSMGLTQPFVLGPYALDGSASTLSGMVSSSKPFEMSGSMARMIVDLDRLDNTLSIISTGQSGQILDLHYQDQIPLFSRNYYHPNLFNRERIRNAGWLKLIVNPKSAP